MNIDWKDALLPGTRLDGNVLTLPAEGGGFVIRELASTAQRWLNMTLTVLETHSMAFELRVYGAEQEPKVVIRFGLMPEYRANIPIDMNWLDGHILFPGHSVGMLKVVCHGSRIERKDVTRAEMVNIASSHAIRLCVEDVSLEDAPRPPAEVPQVPLIDEMGQYIPKSWPGKQKSFYKMVENIVRQAKKPNTWPFANWTEWGGYAPMKLGEGTGFFTNIKHEGRWFLLDPDGCAFFSMGPDCVVARCDARIDGLEPLLSPIPEDPELCEPMDRKWGEEPRRNGKLFSYERANLKRAFGDDWYEKWRKMIVAQLKQMGMNTLGNWSDPKLFGRMPYVTSLPRFPATKHTIFRDFPDVLSPEYVEDAKRCASELTERCDDPYMIGYFLRNEPGWAFVDDLILADEVLRDAEDTWCKRALIDRMKERYGSIDALNAAWETQLTDFADLKRPIAKASAFSENAEHDLRAFSEELVRAYTAIPSDACREADPNHMILGMRWAWISDPALTAGWECFDVFSINCYAAEPTAAIDRVRELGVDLPVMIGEFHFGALDVGLTATGLRAVATQADRGKAYRYYVEKTAAHPMGVGCHWFQCYDQFALGRFDGENYNIGIFDVCLQPYPDLAKAIRDCGATIYDVLAGKRAPIEDEPVRLPMIAY
ncbi:MAG: beta-galactosidase [Christensenellales bacterium]